jgi:hypothetical protein
MRFPEGGAPSQIVINQCVLQQVVTHVESVVRTALHSGTLELRAREQVANRGGNQDLARLRYAENPRCGVDRDASDFLPVELHFTGTDSGASSRLLRFGPVFR